MPISRQPITNKGYFTKNNALMPRLDSYGMHSDSRVEYQIFGSEYFSNADVKIYFGDIWIDDATSFSFSLQEQVLPIYGYHSYTYDAIARGNRLIQGAFSINFKSVGYLNEVLNNAHAILYAMEKGEQENIIQPEFYETMNLSEILELLGKDSFDQIADEYERALWGYEEGSEHYLTNDRQPYFRQDQLGFDIRIHYGAVSEMADYIGRDRYIDSSLKPNVTVEVINGVQLTGLQKQIATSDQGAPIQEVYSFIARDYNGTPITRLKG